MRFDKLGRGYRLVAVVTFNTLLLVAVIEAGFGFVIDIRDAFLARKERTVNPVALLPVYEGFDWSQKLWMEGDEYDRHWSRFEPYLHWIGATVRGEYINVDSRGIRRTVKEPEENAEMVFLFGGSTMLCGEVPDGMTIASRLQERLGSGYDVWNFGQGGYVSTQEVLLLGKQLAEGNIPDRVIFYDGVNDAFAGVCSPAIPRDPHNIRFQHTQAEQAALEAEKSMTGFRQIKGFYDRSNVKRFVEWLNYKLNREGRRFVGGTNIEEWEASIRDSIPKNAALTLQYYNANVEVVKALAKHYGFSCSFFWQPSIITLRRDQLPYEEAIQATIGGVFREGYEAVDAEARKSFAGREGEGMYYIADLFDCVDKPVYVDFCHVGPEGNRMIADKIFATVFGAEEAVVPESEKAQCE